MSKIPPVIAEIHAIDEDELQATWLAYRSEPSESLRRRLILHYAPLVNRVVSRMGLHPDGAIEWNDLINYGVLGLMDAVERFEPERGNTFSTFASLRIRGAVLDALRQMDPLGRLARQRVRRAKEALQALTVQLGRVPTDQEVAQAIDLSEEQYQQVLQDANLIMLSLDQPLGAAAGEEQKLRLGDLLEDPDAVGTLEQVEEAEVQERLAQAIRSLSKREQILLSLYYYEDLTMREVADVMEISQTRVCQLHARALLTLKTIMTSSTEKSSTEKLVSAIDLAEANAADSNFAEMPALPAPSRSVDVGVVPERKSNQPSLPQRGLDRRRSSYRTRRQWTQLYQHKA